MLVAFCFSTSAHRVFICLLDCSRANLTATFPHQKSATFSLPPKTLTEVAATLNAEDLDMMLRFKQNFELTQKAEKQAEERAAQDAVAMQE